MRTGPRRVLALGFAAMLAGAMLVSGCTEAGQPSPEMAAAAGSSASESVAPRHAVGEAFQVNGLTWTVTGSEQLSEIESAFSDTPVHKPVNGAWLVVWLDFRGKEGLDGGFDTAALKLRDDDGALYDVAEPSGAADDYRLTHDDVVNLSLALVGNPDLQHPFAIYDVPAAAGPFALEWMGAEDGSLVTLAIVSLGG